MDVILHSTGCPKCKILKKKLIEKGIKFTETANVDELLNLGFKKVPVLEVEGQFMNFYDANDWINNIYFGASD